VPTLEKAHYPASPLWSAVSGFLASANRRSMDCGAFVTLPLIRDMCFRHL
jgi:hypothetical protein